MALFVSWIIHDDKNWFLTKKELATDKFKELITYAGRAEDRIGHEIIRRYFGIKAGIVRECPDFSSPINFPPDIAQAVKDGDFEGMGAPLEILTGDAVNLLEKSVNIHWDKFDERYQKILWDLIKDPKNRKEIWR